MSEPYEIWSILPFYFITFQQSNVTVDDIYTVSGG